MSATHAVDQPVRAPAFPVQDVDDASRIRAFRVKDDSDARAKAAANQKNASPDKPVTWPLQDGNRGDAGILLSDTVCSTARLPPARAARILCAAEHLGVRRSYAAWAHCERSAHGNLAQESDCTGAGRRTGRSPRCRRLVRFKVASDGRVALPEGIVTLRPSDDLGTRDPTAAFIALDPLGLVSAQRYLLKKGPKAAASADGKQTRSLPFDPINDSLARKLTLAAASVPNEVEVLRLVFHAEATEHE